jgi:hypothetical protein
MIEVSGEEPPAVGSWEPAAKGAGGAIPEIKRLVISEWGPSRLRGVPPVFSYQGETKNLGAWGRRLLTLVTCNGREFGGVAGPDWEDWGRK